MSWARLDAARAKPVRLVVGLMSGTSADGIDACVARIEGSGAATRATTLAFLTAPYPAHVRTAVLGLRDATATEACRWNFDLGDRFADAALAVLAKAGLGPQDADLVGSHGQSIVHLPRAGTLQIGEPAVIAERTGLPVIADFRPADIAAGGEGAPLVPWVDWLTLRVPPGPGEAPRARIVQNLGGVANVTLVTQDPEGVVAFDVGPANAPIDAAASLVTRGELRHDVDGRLAAAGRVHEDVVRSILDRDAYLDRPPPKSASRETWGEPMIEALAAMRPGLAGADLVATMTECVARGIAASYRRFLPLGDVADVVVSGGGVHNPVLMRRLADLLAPLPVRSSAELGIDPDAREALAFAVLANESLSGNPGNLPQVTGARRPVVLGKITL